LVTGEKTVMFKGLKNLFGGGGNEGLVKEFGKLADRIIEEYGPRYAALSDAELGKKTEEFRSRLEKGEKENTLLLDVFAAVREAAWRTRKMKHYKVQLIGGMVLNQGKIAEMKTGEGKTLMATCAAYYNALAGKGVHVVTVNDYLVRRDAQWMGPIYKMLGMSVGVIQSSGGNPNVPDAYILDFEYENKDPNFRYLRPVSRKEAYAADITHGTNNEFGFDYLRDNMARSLENLAQRETGLYFAIVDEVDNILIDEARTPLIISGQADKAQDDYYRFASLVKLLKKGRDYEVDEKKRVVNINEDGIDRMERELRIPDIESIYDDKWSHYVTFLENALKAKELYMRDKEYVVRENEIVIVDEFTGRMQEGRRWEGGLHQAIEAKEGVKIQHETLTYATITLQNYFRMYKKLAGMTGTAATEAEEFFKIYGLDVVIIPTHRDMIRDDANDLIYRNEDAKYRAVIEDIHEMYEIRRPVLVGTTSVEKSEYISQLLDGEGIPHSVLNAKLHDKEAVIVAQAGRPGAITIATNMAGRGTDIILGGSPESYLEEELRERGLTDSDRNSEAYQEAVEAANDKWQEAHDYVLSVGGLHIVGTERHESRRIDNQLRGRAGRQGDPGSSRFYVSLDDELMRRFGSERIAGILERFGFDEETHIENSFINKSISQAQERVEGQNFDFRKHLVEYDQVMNTQRATIYKDRREILGSDDLRDRIIDLTNERVAELVEEYTAGDHDEWDYARLLRNVGLLVYTKPLELSHRPKDPDEMEEMALHALEEKLELTLEDIEGKSRDELKEIFAGLVDRMYDLKEAEQGKEDMLLLTRLVMLEVLDKNWVNYLTPMEELRRGIGLRAYGQQDPLQAYKKAAREMWDDLQGDIRREIAQQFWAVHLQRAPIAPPIANLQESGPGVEDSSPANGNGNRARGGGGTATKTAPARTAAAKVNPNAPCPCGSGKKFKKCHGSVV
jgi:preprotein translocase subunit SecA